MKKGLTLIEVLFVLGIMAILLGLTFVVYAKVNSKIAGQEATTLTTEIVNAANVLSSSQSNFDGVTTQSIIDSGLVDKKYIKDNIFYLKGGGYIYINTLIYQGQPYLYIYYNSVPQALCQYIWHSSLYFMSNIYSTGQTFVTNDYINTTCKNSMDTSFALSYDKR